VHDRARHSLHAGAEAAVFRSEGRPERRVAEGKVREAAVGVGEDASGEGEDRHRVRLSNHSKAKTERIPFAIAPVNRDFECVYLTECSPSRSKADLAMTFRPALLVLPLA